MSDLLQDLRFGARTLRNAPAFTAVAVCVLALGIGANSAMFTIVNAMMFRPLSGKADELVGVYSRDRTKPDIYRAFSYPEYVDARDRSDVFAGLMAHSFAMVGLPAGEGMRQTFVDVVTSNYFETLGVQLAAGRSFTAEEERPGARIPVVIVGQDRAGLLGQTMKINTIDFTVVGVVPRGFSGTMALAAPDLWLPMGMFDTVVNDVFKNKATGLEDRTSRPLVLAGRLKQAVSPAAAGPRLDLLSQQLEKAYPAENKDQVLTISPLPRMSTSTSPGSDTGLGTAASLLMGLSGVVLLIACLNIANMLLARGTDRRKEVAIRLAVGGGRGRIVRQLLTEGLLLAIAGAAGGLVLAFWATSALVGSLRSILPLTLQFDTRPDATVLIATAAFAIVATALFGLGPALKLSRLDLVSDLKGLTADGGLLGRRFSGRNVMVVGQIALSLMLLSTGGLFARAALKAAAADPGFSYRQQLIVSTDPSMVQYDETHGRASHRDTLNRLRSITGVEAVGMASTVPFGSFHEGRQVERVAGRPGEGRGHEPVFRIISGEYFRALDLPMVRGREFTATEEQSASAPPVAIVDQQLARRLFGNEDPIGQMIRFTPRPDQPGMIDSAPLQIVGIAPPVRDELFDSVPGPAIYVASGRNYRSQMHFHVREVRAGAEADVLATIRRELHAMDPRLPLLEATTLQAFHNDSLELWAVRAGGRLFLVFGVLALTLAVIGLYGLKSYVVSRRTREIGVRMALGADAGSVMRMVLKEGMMLSGVGLATGLPLAALVGRLLAGLLYHVQPLDPVVFVSAPVVFGAAAILAAWIPARRATKVSPIIALRGQ